MTNPMDVARAMMAFQRQAAEQIAACNAQLASAGLGFGADERAAIAAGAAAYAQPAQPSSPADLAAAQEVAAKAMAAEYPPDGFAPDDPRLAPIEGVSIALYAIGSRAIAWAPVGDELYERVPRALGVEPDRWQRASDGWNARVRDDVVLAAFYGQLYVAAAT